MKKTLLCILFLFTTVFYAQVTPIVHCFGDNIFDLSKQKIDLIGNLDPAETTVSYHLSLADAINNSNAIANPSNYNTAASSTTIYARIDNNGTITTNYFDLIVNPVLTADTTIKYVNCVPTIIITGNGGNSNYEYSHAGVIFTQNNVITNPSPGSQTVYVRDGNGCVASKSLIVESLSPLSWIANKMDPVSCQGSNDGIIQITGSGGKAPYLYSIGNDNEFTASNIFKNLDVGNYTLKIQDATGCIISFSLNITQRYPSIAVAVVTTNDSNSSNEGKIDLIISSGTAPYTYSLKDSNEILIPSKITNPFTGLAVGSYEAIVTDSNGCTSSQKGINILNVSTPLTVTAGVTPITCVITTGTITITPNGGVLPYQYSIDNGNTYTNSNVFPNLVAGTYNIKVHDDEGTEVSIATTVEPVNLPFITTTVTNLLCNGASNGRIIVGAGGGKSPNVFSINGGPYTSYNVFDNLPAGTYLATAKDSNGCIVSKSVVLSTPPPITFNITIKDKTVTVDATGGDAKNPNNYALDGGNYSTGTVFSNVSYGNHVIHVKTPNNCMSSTSIEVTVPLVSTVAVDKGTITVTATGGTPPYNYSLKDPSGMSIITAQSSNTFTEVVNGSYTIVVTDSKANTSVQAYINISESSSFSATALINPITCINPRGIITVTATGGKSPYQYSLDYGLHYTTSNVFSDLTAGSYTITVRDSRNYMTAVSATVTAAKPVLVSAEIISDVSCNGGSDGRVRANVIQGQPPYVYLLDGKESQVNNTFNNLYSGVHTIKVTDNNNCTANLSFTISEPTAPLNSTIAVNNKTITAPTNGGTPPYTYSLYDNIGLVTGPQTSDSFDNLPIGLYNLQIIDAKGCAFLQNGINISEFPLLSPTATITPITCNNSTGTITVVTTGGSGPYEYSLDNGINYTPSNVFTGLTPGTYNINVKDSQNTTTSVIATITDVKPVLISATLISAVSCNGANNGSIKTTVIQAQAPYVYKLDNVDFYDSNAEYTFNNLSAGEHTIQVIDNNSCTSFVSITIPEPTLLSSTVVVNNKTISVNTTGGVPPYSYTLQDNDTGATITGPQTSNVFTNLPTGVYSVQVIDSTICSLLKTGINISNSNTLSASFSVSPITCNNPAGMITVVATGGSGPYEYSLDNGINYTPSNVFTGLTPGTYNINVKDSQNTTTSVIATISPLQPLVADAILTKTIDCLSNASINVIASGGKKPYQYSFDNGLTYNANNTFTNINAGTYFVNVKDSLDCTIITSSITIEQPIPLYANFTTADGMITANATGGIAPYSYALTDNNGLTVIPFQNSNIFTGLTNGLYGVEVRDATGCTYFQTDITIVNKPNSLLATTAVTPTTCLNPTGTITISASGGLVPYQYSVDNGAYVSSNVFLGLTPGTYMIKVRDAENNITSIVAVITPVNAPAISATVNSNVLCRGDNTGSITAVATGGQAPYTYSLDGITFNTTNVFTNLRVGTFNITVKDTNGCTAKTTIVLTEPAEDLSATAILINDQGIIVNAKGGTAPYKYYLQNNNGIVVAGPQTDGIFTRLPIGRYSAQITDANGCGYIHWSVDVSAAPTLSATADVHPITCIDAGTITVNATGGFQPYYYSFDNGATYTNSNVYSSFKPGTYTVKVRDYQNTTFSITAMITQGSTPVINATVTNINCKGEASGFITTNVTGGLAPYTYSLDNGSYVNGNSSMTFANLYAGTHLITVKDANGCLTTTQVVISEPVSALMTVTTVKSQTITINASGGAGNYRYAISPNLDIFSTNNIFSGLTPGSYIVNTSDVNGCYMTMNTLVDPPAPLINGQTKLTLEFKPGQTLADLIIDGQNIKWYINQSPLAGKTSRTSEVPLPLTTVIVEGTTYYASQTINGIESTERMAVTAKSSALGTNDLVIKNFEYYPNPVKNVLTISNTSIIDEVTFISIKGETLLTKKINSLRSEIDLSNFSNGVYFLKIKSEGAEKTVKLIKE